MAERTMKITPPVLKEKGLSIVKLNNILKFWQKKLGLEDWDMAIKIVDFKRTDYCQSGDFKADLKNKKAILYLTWQPFLKNQKTLARQEEQTIVHELVHIALWEFDSFVEKAILKNCRKFEGDHDRYLEKLEKTVDKLTDIILGKEKG